jgi:hypothetical protein
VDGVEVSFPQLSLEEGERVEQFRCWIGAWLREKPGEGAVRPGLEPTTVGSG